MPPSHPNSIVLMGGYSGAEQNAEIIPGKSKASLLPNVLQMVENFRMEDFHWGIRCSGLVQFLMEQQSSWLEGPHPLRGQLKGSATIMLQGGNPWDSGIV